MKNKFLADNKENFYFVFRVLVAIMFFMHGTQKLLGWFGGTIQAPWTLFWTAGLIETVAGLLILVGLWVQWAAVISALTMLVAYFKVHATASNFYLPLANGGEKALLFFAAMLVLASYGAGKWALEKSLRK